MTEYRLRFNRENREFEVIESENESEFDELYGRGSVALSIVLNDQSKANDLADQINECIEVIISDIKNKIVKQTTGLDL